MQRLLIPFLFVIGLFFAPRSALSQGLPAFPGSSRTPAASAPDANAPKVRPSVRASASTIARGEGLAIALILEFQPHWHAWPGQGQNVLPPEIDEFAIRTTLALADAPPWISAVGPVQWPTPAPGKVADFNNPGKTITVPLFQDRIVAYLPILIAKDAPLGEQKLGIAVGYQACDETLCEMPEDITLDVTLQIAESGAGSNLAPADDADFNAFDASVLEGLRSGAIGSSPAARAENDPPADPATAAAPPTSGSTFFGVSLSGLSGPRGLVILTLLGMLGGFILNLTPCVLPVIPIKVLTLTKHAGSPGRSLMLAFFMSLGVIAFWLALGVPAAFVSSLADPSRLFGIWWLTTGIGLLIGLMGLGIMGLFSINLPQAVYMVNPETDSPGGSFMFGVMTAVLGLPCFGFVAGALLPAAATFGSLTTILIFGALGVGMAAPYLILAARPQWVERVPRTGPASELVKQVMGLLLIAAAAYFFGAGMIALVQDYPYLGKLLHWWGVAVFGSIAGLWLAYRTFKITRKPTPRAVFGVIAIIIASGGIFAALTMTNQARHNYIRTEAATATAEQSGGWVRGAWVNYRPGLADRARKEGKIVVLDFTAEWCINCKTLKAAVLDVDPVRSAFDADDVVLIEVDLTSRRAPGWELLRSLGQTGIPLLTIQGPKQETPWLSNAYTAPQVLAAMQAARPERTP